MRSPVELWACWAAMKSISYRLACPLMGATLSARILAQQRSWRARVVQHRRRFLGNAHPQRLRRQHVGVAAPAEQPLENFVLMPDVQGDGQAVGRLLLGDRVERGRLTH